MINIEFPITPPEEEVLMNLKALSFASTLCLEETPELAAIICFGSALEKLNRAQDLDFHAVYRQIPSEITRTGDEQLFMHAERKLMSSTAPKGLMFYPHCLGVDIVPTEETFKFLHRPYVKERGQGANCGVLAVTRSHLLYYPPLPTGTETQLIDIPLV